MKTAIKFLIFLFVMTLFSLPVNSETIEQDIELSAPVQTGGMPLMDVLKNRHSSVRFSKEVLSNEHLSNLLWAANGVNRENGKRTAPSVRNSNFITIYVSTAKGIYKYNSEKHVLNAFSKEDLRPIIGRYPLVLLYVADLKYESKYYAAVDVGFISENVYLYSAANNLNTAFLPNINVYALNSKLNLKLGEEVLFAQVVGYPVSK